MNWKGSKRYRSSTTRFWTRERPFGKLERKSSRKSRISNRKMRNWVSKYRKLPTRGFSIIFET